MNAICPEDFKSHNLVGVKSTEKLIERQPQALISNKLSNHPSDLQEARASASSNSPTLKNMAGSQTGVSSPCAILNDAYEAIVNLDQEINKGLNRKNFVDLDELNSKSEKDKSSDHSITGSTPVNTSSGKVHLLTHIRLVNMDNANLFLIPPTGSTNEHSSIEETDNEFMRSNGNIANIEKKEEREETTSEASSNAGIDPMILKYMKVVKEKHKMEKPKEDESFDSNKPEEKANSSFSAFLLARQVS